MNQVLSRRKVLKISVVTLGALTLYGFGIASYAHEPTTLTSLKNLTAKEDNVPHVSVKLYPGRSEQQKERLAQAIAQNLVDIIQCSRGSVSVAIEEIPPQDWKKRVYDPEIMGKSELLYVKPGYTI
jgi:4-oxalocrotonate tautomerase